MTVINNKFEMDSAFDMNVGDVGTVRGFTRRDVASKLLAMGVLPGSRIELIRISPFGGAYYIAIDTHFMALRQKELLAIHVQK